MGGEEDGEEEGKRGRRRRRMGRKITVATRKQPTVNVYSGTPAGYSTRSSLYRFSVEATRTKALYTGS